MQLNPKKHNKTKYIKTKRRRPPNLKLIMSLLNAIKEFNAKDFRDHLSVVAFRNRRLLFAKI